jgi:hypothetical protein
VQRRRCHRVKIVPRSSNGSPSSGHSSRRPTAAAVPGADGAAATGVVAPASAAGTASTAAATTAAATSAAAATAAAAVCAPGASTIVAAAVGHEAVPRLHRAVEHRRTQVSEFSLTFLASCDVARPSGFSLSFCLTGPRSRFARLLPLLESLQLQHHRAPRQAHRSRRSQGHPARQLLGRTFLRARPPWGRYLNRAHPPLSLEVEARR